MGRERIYLDDDWYPGGVPANVAIGSNVYLDTSYGFAGFFSEREPGLVLGEASGAYDRAAFLVGRRGTVTVGPYTCLNGSYLICADRIQIGAHCLLAWGSVVTDCWPGPNVPREVRRAALRAAARDPRRPLPSVASPRPVTVEDNVWIGFDAVVLPGVTLGRGCVVGCKTVIQSDVPRYAVVVGDPPRIIRYLEPDDTEGARTGAMQECCRPDARQREIVHEAAS